MHINQRLCYYFKTCIMQPKYCVYATCWNLIELFTPGS